MPTVNSPENVGQIEKMIDEKDYEKALSYPTDYVWVALKNIQSRNPERTLLENLDLLDNLRIGDVNKRQVARLSPIFRRNLSEEILKSLFSNDFISSPLECSDDEKYHVMYEQLKPTIQVLVG